MMDARKTIYQKLTSKSKKKFDDSTSVTDLGIDSLDLMVLVTDAEEEFGITIDDDDLKNIKIVGDIINAFEKAFKK